ncbi:MAG TPA: MCE family protein [Pseudonocardiaceae bacterium]|nr:MCE family protein [Pseudonocardiaceae bacterium]
MKRSLVVTLAAMGAFGLVACGSGGFSGLYGAPLPGGADLGPHPYTVTADFADVLDLVPQASVKVNDVAVGRVDRIDLAADNKTAEVTMSVNGDVQLPGNAGADLRQSSLLGEKYVELIAPPGGTGTLRDGAVIPTSRTNRGPEIEEVLGALSLLLNGGGIEQIQNIVRELNSALSGNEPELRALLSNVDTTVTYLDGQRTEITNAIQALDRLSATLAGQTGEITDALRNLAPGLQVLNTQRDQLVTMLKSLDTLSGVAVDTVNQSQNQLVTDLKQLRPTLAQLAKAADNLPKSLQVLITYPFTDYTVNDVKGDYFNADVRLDLDLSRVLSDIANSSTPVIPLPASLNQATSPAPLPAATQPAPTITGGLTGLLSLLLGGGGR